MIITVLNGNVQITVPKVILFMLLKKNIKYGLFKKSPPVYRGALGILKKFKCLILK